MNRLAPYIAELDRLVGWCLGRRLSSVVYRTIENECGPEDVAAGIEWIGGEVQLAFDGGSPLFVGWNENDGWSDDFSLAVQANSMFRPNTLVPFDANGAPVWSALIGSPLMGASCRGSNGTPHALILQFPSGTIAIGDGYQGVIGDGDDVVILPLDRCDPAELPEQLWSVGTVPCFPPSPE